MCFWKRIIKFGLRNNISNTSFSIGFSLSSLYLIELTLIWPIMIFCGWFDGRDLSMVLTDYLQSLGLLRLKFEFSFINYSKFDFSKILLSFCFSSLLESMLHQTLQIIYIKFSASWGVDHYDADVIC